MYYAFDGAPPPPRAGAAHATIYPYGPFPTGDGKTVMLGLQNEREWQQFCAKVLQQPELAKDERFAGNAKRVTHRDGAARADRRGVRGADGRAGAGARSTMRRSPTRRSTTWRTCGRTSS